MSWSYDKQNAIWTMGGYVVSEWEDAIFFPDETAWHDVGLSVENCKLVCEWHARIAALEAQLAAAEKERDDALSCLRRCGVAASDLLTNPEGITPQAQHAMDNPLQADELVNNRICELECSEAQLQEQLAASEARAREAERESDKWRARCANAVFLIPDNVLCGDIRKQAESFTEELTAAKSRADAAEAKLAAVREKAEQAELMSRTFQKLGLLKKIYDLVKEPAHD